MGQTNGEDGSVNHLTMPTLDGQSIWANPNASPTNSLSTGLEQSTPQGSNFSKLVPAGDGGRVFSSAAAPDALKDPMDMNADGPVEPAKPFDPYPNDPYAKYYGKQTTGGLYFNPEVGHLLRVPQGLTPPPPVVKQKTPAELAMMNAIGGQGTGSETDGTGDAMGESNSSGPGADSDSNAGDSGSGNSSDSDGAGDAGAGSDSDSY